jgi:tRNA (guanine-N7-)-methyltransferase
MLIRTYGRVRGKGFNVKKQEYIDNSPLILKDDLIEGDILDIGFGTGDSTIQIAKSNATKKVVGIEPYKSGVYSLLLKIQKEKLDNIRVINGDCRSVKIGYFEEIYALFPDPWPKKSHKNRRLLTVDFLNYLMDRCRVLKIATDNEEYMVEILGVLKNYLVNQYDVIPPVKEVSNGFPLTKYAQKACNKCFYIEFSKETKQL